MNCSTAILAFYLKLKRYFYISVSYLLLFLFFVSTFTLSAQTKHKHRVYFAFDSSDLDESSKLRLDSLIDIGYIRELTIQAHCDSFGSISYNEVLSLKRATAVKQYLLMKGIPSENIKVSAFGERQPLNSNATKTERALNRRAELVFLTKPTVEVAKEDTMTTDSIFDTPVKQEASTELADNKVLITDSTEIKIEDIGIGSGFRLENLNFYGGRHILLPQSYKSLDLLLKTLKANPGLELEIQGHICCLSGNVDGRDHGTGTNDLSVNRAKAIYDYLIRKGIKAKRLSYVGFGAGRKLVPERTEDDMTTNRRVEFKVIKK